MKSRTYRAVVALAGICFLVISSAVPGQDVRGSEEEAADGFRDWLKKDVSYIITDDEREIFTHLTTPEERERFIEQFWCRRDPDPRTPINEFKEEHYRRIAYANEHFASGQAGWQTDRGRIYILLGPPDTLERRPAGGAYQRSMEEGGGTTSVYPYEKWTYRHLEGIGDNVDLEFVDSTGTEEYRLAVFDWEKDALMMVPGGGPTLAEMLGQSTRSDRSALTPAAGGAGYGERDRYRRVDDTPFQRYARMAELGAAPVVEHKELEALVEVDLRYETLPFELEAHFFRLGDDQTLVPLTLRIDTRDLSYSSHDGTDAARLGMYGRITDLGGQVVWEFERDFTVRRASNPEGATGEPAALLQEIVPLGEGSRYKLVVVLRDLASGKTGLLRQALIPPHWAPDSLQGSSLLLSHSIQSLGDDSDRDEMFVIGNLKVVPRVNREFTTEMPLGIYLQLYRVGVDPSTFRPQLRVTCNLIHDGETLKSAVDDSGASIQFVSSRRVVLTQMLSLLELQPGAYAVEVRVEDLLTGRSCARRADFRIIDSPRG